MGGFMLGMVVGVLVNLVTALFSRRHAVMLIPWMCLYIALHGLIVIASTNTVWTYFMSLAAKHPSHWSYVLVVIVCSLAGVIFWHGVQKGANHLETVTSAVSVMPSNLPPEEPPSVSQKHTPPSGHPSVKDKAQSSGEINEFITKADFLGDKATLSSAKIVTFDSNAVLVINNGNNNMYDVSVQVEETPDGNLPVGEMIARHASRKIFTHYFALLHPLSWERANINLPTFPPENAGWKVTITNRAGGSSTTFFNSIPNNSNQYVVQEFKDQILTARHTLTLRKQE